MATTVANIMLRGKKLTTVIRLKPFDTATEDGRSNERFRRMALTSLASFGAKGFSMLGLLISVPLTLHYLGQERYGLWMTISSFIVMLSFADLGMGNGILTVLSKAHGKDDRLAAQRCVSSGFFMLSAVAGLILTVFFLSYPFISWNRFFSVGSPLAIKEVGPALIVLVISFTLGMPLGIVQRAQNGFQEGFQSNLWQCLTSVVSLALIIVAIHLHAGLPWLVASIEGAQVIVGLLNWIFFFGIQYRWLLPNYKYWRREDASHLFRTGLLFFVLQLALSFAITSDNIVAAHVLGSKAVAQYSIVARLFSVITVISNMLVTPMWAAYGEAFSRGDINWVKIVLIRSLKVVMLFTVIPATIFAIFGSNIVQVWVGHGIATPLLLLLGFASWSILGNVGNAMSMFMNGLHVVRFQVICAVSFAALGIFLKMSLAHLIGISGVIVGTVISYSLFIMLPYSMFVIRFLRQPEELGLSVNANC